MSSADGSAKSRVIRDKNFAKRLDQAVYGHPHAPEGHGRQKWLRERIESRFNHKLSPEAVRKWFSGEARPRPNVMSMVAQVLEVDEAWLALAITPDTTPIEKRQHNAVVTGAVNLVAGMIQMSNGHIAFPELPNELIDLYAIIDGKQISLLVRSPKVKGEGFQLTVPHSHDRSVVLAVFQQSATSYIIVRVSAELLSKHGKNQGGYIELDVDHNGQIYRVGEDALPVIRSFSNLDGETPIRR